MPRSFSFLRYNLIFYVVVEFFLQANMTDDPIESFTEVLIETVLTLALIALLLSLNKILYAYVQVASALVFCSNVVAATVIPVLIWMTMTEDSLSFYVLGFQLFWEFLLIAYILRRIMAINWPASLVAALCYFVVTYYGAFALGQLL